MNAFLIYINKQRGTKFDAECHDIKSDAKFKISSAQP
jgi:hypothetical protein